MVTYCEKVPVLVTWSCDFDFLVSKRGLNTLLAQLVSILRTKLRELVIEFKNDMFLNFQYFFSQKVNYFEVATFFLTKCQKRLNFSLLAYILVHGTEAKLVSNWEQNMLYTKS